MNRILLSFCLLTFLTLANCFADPSDQVITLKDGSQIKGQLSGIENGVYTVKTPIIGDVHVAASDVASITNASISAPVPNLLPNTQPASTGTSPNMDDRIAASQKQLMSNPQSMAELMQMIQDPDVVKALSDPSVVQAVTNHDYQAVQNNPKIQELMSNPKMQELLQKLAAQQQQQNSTAQ